MTWDELSSRVRKFQTGFMGEPDEARLHRGSFHENPFSCICRNSEAVSEAGGVETSGEMFIDEAFSEDYHYLPEMEFE